MARAFDGLTLARLRSIPLWEALEGLGLFVKQDQDFVPVKNASTVRWWVSVDSMVYELLVTEEKWFDVREEKGGGGAIDLCMYLFDLEFVAAVKRLLKAGL
ncbi:MAG: hypothetical protein EOO38_10335 [Cytophagaceae bacterium]|nr:MAG: hypothetical protein EOO38_10335 [Cytophagaceae bacterium]